MFQLALAPKFSSIPFCLFLFPNPLSTPSVSSVKNCSVRDNVFVLYYCICSHQLVFVCLIFRTEKSSKINMLPHDKGIRKIGIFRNLETIRMDLHLSQLPLATYTGVRMHAHTLTRTYVIVEKKL